MGLFWTALALAGALHLRAPRANATETAAAELPRAGRPVLWYHVHKSAGTLMCKTAHAANERVVHPNRNCNWYPTDGVVNINTGHEPTCAERAAYFRHGSYTWGAVEHEFRSSVHPCPQFMYATMLRESAQLVDSIASTHDGQFNSRSLVPLRNALALLQNGTHAVAGEAEDYPNTYGLPAWAWLDNFQTRLFADAFHVSPGMITHEHLRKAASVLDKFSVVMVLSQLQKDAPRLLNTLKWPLHVASMFHHKVNQHPSVPIFNVQEKAFLVKVNKFDRMLVDLFRN